MSLPPSANVFASLLSALMLKRHMVSFRKSVAVFSATSVLRSKRFKSYLVAIAVNECSSDGMGSSDPALKLVGFSPSQNASEPGRVATFCFVPLRSQKTSSFDEPRSKFSSNLPFGALYTAADVFGGY